MKNKISMMIMMTALIAAPVIVQSVKAQGEKGKTAKQVDASKQKKQSFELKSTKVEAGRGSAQDPNIKDGNMANTKDQQFPAPPEKGGPTGRGAIGLCRVDFGNLTNLRIQLYVDGAFRGILAPYGDSSFYTGAGPTRVYARAEFIDGSALNWGPTDYTCYPGQYIDFKMKL